MANTIPSPLSTLLPFISAEEATSMAYPPDAMPGARDVETFYGSMRVYEWGPTNGDKVLAWWTLDRYRVMLFDLWGRGYSDTPLNCRHDIRLFATQIVLALTSSPLSWIGNDTNFSIIAFSLGAPISLAFSAAYPSSVRSLVLLGPAGLLRKLPEGYDDQLMHQPELAPSPESIREKVQEILGVAPSAPTLGIQLDKRHVVSIGSGPSRVEKSFNMEGIFQWQFDHHQGHIHSFQDTIRYGPLQAPGLWRKVCRMIAGRARPDAAIYGSRLLVFFGKDDEVVAGAETTEDILELLPASHLQIQYLPGGHGFPYPNSESITQSILSSWACGTTVH